MKRLAPAPYAITPKSAEVSTARRIVSGLADIMGVMPFEITGQARERRLARARWAAMVALRRRGLSTTQIGRHLGDRDHTTVMHGLKEAAKLQHNDPTFAAMVTMAERLA
jgi:chromosomal replication initiator protein